MEMLLIVGMVYWFLWMQKENQREVMREHEKWLVDHPDQSRAPE